MGRLGQAHEAQPLLDAPDGHPHPLGAPAQRQRGGAVGPGRVLEQDEAVALGGAPRLGEGLAAHRGGGGGGVEVGVLEQAGAEEGAQQPGGRGLEARPGRSLAVALGDEAVGLDDGGGLAVAAELVDAVVDGQAVALGDAKVLHPVAALPEIAHLRIRVGGDAPVGAHDAVEAVAAPQHVVDDDPVVGVGARDGAVGPVVEDGPVRGAVAPGDRVVGHDGAGAAGGAVQAEGGLGEGHQVLGLVAPRVDGELAEAVVGVAPALAGAAAGPVLDHGHHRGRPPAGVRDRGLARADPEGRAGLGAVGLGGLHGVAVGAGVVGHEPAVGPPGVLEAHPARVGGQVDLGAQRGGDAQGPVLARDDGGALAHPLGVEQGGHAQALGPAGDVDGGGGELGPGGLPGAVARVCGDVDGHARRLGLGQGLEGVVPPGGRVGRLEGDGQDVAEVVVGEHGALLVGRRPGGGAGLLAGPAAVVGAREGADAGVGDGLVGRVEHEAGDLLDAQPPGQVGGPLGGGQAPVLVGQEPAGAGQVLEQQPVDLDDGGARRAQGGPVRLGVEGDDGLGAAGGIGVGGGRVGVGRCIGAEGCGGCGRHDGVLRVVIAARRRGRPEPMVVIHHGSSAARGHAYSQVEERGAAVRGRAVEQLPQTPGPLQARRPGSRQSRFIGVGG